MYKDMIETIIGSKPCKSCETKTRHMLVELVIIGADGEIHELIDAWWQCRDCDQTSAILVAPDDYPF